MDGLAHEFGARFIVGDLHPTVTTEGFAQGALQDVSVRRALAGSRFRLLKTEADEELDKTTGRAFSRECEAVFYDYTHNRAVHVTGAAGGHGPFQVRASNAQPVPSLEEFEEAVALVAQSPAWGPLLQSGNVRAYEPMPPMLEPKGDEAVERTLYVGLSSRERRFNRIVSVNMVRRQVSREPAVLTNSIATEVMCGVTPVDCPERPIFRGVPGTAVIEWPANDPVWSFRAIRPSASTGTNGSGIELRNVRYKGKLVLNQAHVPILNVKYDDEACGPYRDWLYSETCFIANGTDIAGSPGFRWCTEPPQTVYESGMDGGNFVGVAVYETTDGGLGLVSQCLAGWYRYIVEWRFYPDGRILPIFRFGDVNNSCVCHIHTHHVLWRLDFDIMGEVNAVQEQVNGVWQTITHEASRYRKADLSPFWRVKHFQKAVGYDIIPGSEDGTGDDFSGPDLYVLRQHPKQIDDGRGDVSRNTATNLIKFLNKESVKGEDLVVWYGAHFRHAMGDPNELDGIVGPTLQPWNWPD